mmetsp:Transcript_96348/g.215732  ORF Transcript_96348/g.215732 Transcript_96348/m.215732 type:complete len:241 (+) Transcript_96348:256-978(+)
MEVREETALPECCHPPDVVHDVLCGARRHRAPGGPRRGDRRRCGGCGEGPAPLLKNRRNTVALALCLKAEIEASPLHSDDLQGIGLHTIDAAKDVQYIAVKHALNGLRRKVRMGLEVDRLVRNLEHATDFKERLHTAYPEVALEQGALTMPKATQVELHSRGDLREDVPHRRVRLARSGGACLPEPSNDLEVVPSVRVVHKEVHSDLRLHNSERRNDPSLRARLRSHLHELFALHREAPR